MKRFSIRRPWKNWNRSTTISLWALMTVAVLVLALVAPVLTLAQISNAPAEQQVRELEFLVVTPEDINRLCRVAIERGEEPSPEGQLYLEFKSGGFRQYVTLELTRHKRLLEDKGAVLKEELLPTDEESTKAIVGEIVVRFLTAPFVAGKLAQKKAAPVVAPRVIVVAKSPFIFLASP